MISAVPIEIHHMKEKSLVRIQWDDGHSGDYPCAHLRGYCPCALCQGHGGHIKFVEGVPSGLSEITPVGNYAIQFAWEDGHSTGIYTFEYLRSLCPCADCQRAKATGQRKEA
jgi:DUF971 family protein